MARQTGELITKMTADATGFLSGVSKADKSVKRFEKTNATVGKKVSTIWKAVITAAVVVAGVKIAKAAIKIGKELAVLGDKSLSLKKSFKSLAESAGANSKKLLADMKKATRGTIAEVDMLSAANRMLLLGLDTSIFDEVMEIARRTAKATGMDINYMVESLSMGLGRQSKMILDNLGIVFDTSTAYEWYAETIGKTSAQLTENEKRLGFQTYAMKVARDNVERLGEDTLTLAEVGGIFTAKWADLRAFIGEKLVEAIGKVIEKFGGWETIMGKVEQFIEGTVKPAIVGLIGKIEEFGIKLAEADYSEFIKELKGLGKAIGEIAGTLTTLGGKVEESKSDWEGFIKVVSGIIWVFKKIAQFINIIVIGIESMAAVIAWVITPILEMAQAFITGWQEGETFTEKLISALVNVSLQSGRFDELKKKGMEAVETIGKDLVDAVYKFIGIEIPIKEAKIKHNFPKVEQDYFALNRKLRNIERTVTYTLRTVGGRPTAGLRSYQFGGIIPKTQRILAHGGEMMLTKEDQRNLFALLRQPRSISHTYSTPITVYATIREEADIRRVAEELEDIRVLGARAGGVKQ